MEEEARGERAVAALLRVGDLLKETYGKNRQRFSLDSEDRARLEYTLNHFVEFVRVNPPSPTNSKAIEQVNFHLEWLWGVVLYQANPIRSVIGDAEFNRALRELSWIEAMVRDRNTEGDDAFNRQPVVHCGNCNRPIPGRYYALCAECQVDGYRICA